jgi:hypothetical protein
VVANKWSARYVTVLPALSRYYASKCRFSKRL